MLSSQHLGVGNATKFAPINATINATGKQHSSADFEFCRHHAPPLNSSLLLLPLASLDYDPRKPMPVLQPTCRQSRRDAGRAIAIRSRTVQTPTSSTGCIFIAFRRRCQHPQTRRSLASTSHDNQKPRPQLLLPPKPRPSPPRQQQQHSWAAILRVHARPMAAYSHVNERRRAWRYEAAAAAVRRLHALCQRSRPAPVPPHASRYSRQLPPAAACYPLHAHALRKTRCLRPASRFSMRAASSCLPLTAYRLPRQLPAVRDRVPQEPPPAHATHKAHRSPPATRCLPPPSAMHRAARHMRLLSACLAASRCQLSWLACLPLPPLATGHPCRRWRPAHASTSSKSRRPRTLHASPVCFLLATSAHDRPFPARTR
ncbi:hypothetical protein GGX14DRAFT_555555 [Mycena pura]|uniref:Uncharacterized protein n=1 Tax=Mycena pura TaxID=153505 RepID=A0AAD6YR95_9AGAR|nr:hypothetical protein GGX14DRAFT_555555 [Mycena pura]